MGAFEWYRLHSPSRDDRDAFALCSMDGFRVVSAIAAMKFTLYCSVLASGNCRNNSGRFPHYCSIRYKNLVL